MSENTAIKNSVTELTQSSLTALQAGELHVMRRDNRTVVPFNLGKITTAISKAYLAVEGKDAAPRRLHEVVEELGEQVNKALARYIKQGGLIHIEEIQDQVELALMRQGLHKVAREYILYREEKRLLRESKEHTSPPSVLATDQIYIVLDDGESVLLDETALNSVVRAACGTLSDVDPSALVAETKRNIFNGIKAADLRKALIMSARTKIEAEPNYSYVAARLLSEDLQNEALQFLGFTTGLESNLPLNEKEALYRQSFKQFIHRGVALDLLSPELQGFDLDRLSEALKLERDQQFTYLGLQTLYDRYFIHSNNVRFELPQVFFMRVAMGLCLKEEDKNARAIEFYHLISSFDYMSSTPTLFNSGTNRPQLSSCFLSTVPDDLEGIYNALKDNALLSKFAGGLGNDWTNVRAMGAHIQGTNGKSQGVVPFLKVANDTAVAVNQGGKRKGALCSYLETWHLDIDEFLELRKNTGDDRRRTHDMNTANWIPDLFMKRMIENKMWTLFSPDDVPDLHDLYGAAFETAYENYEQKAANGIIKNFKQVPAVNLWRKMLGLIFETGHPWITFKDPCNLRSPQQHVGVIHSSNLCTEITLNTSADEIAVCNLGSINLSQHINANGIDLEKLKKTTQTALRMLDNVIDLNYYSVIQAKRSNLRHRPVGMGIMGFQDALYKLNIPYSSQEAVEFADKTMEAISYYAIQASCDLAAERGVYPTFEGSLWSKGILPIDSIALLAEYRGEKYLSLDRSSTLEWASLRERVKTVGVRNSNIMAIAPTATISNICGVCQSIEPTYQNLYVKSNLSGEFTVVNPYLVEDLKKLNIWDEVLVNDLKYFNGSVQEIDRIPDHIKAKYATAFEIDPAWLIEAGARRQKWLDQSQSLNLYIAKASGKAMDAMYQLAWLRGLKTSYYARSLGASDAEKSTVSRGTLNAVTTTNNINNINEIAVTTTSAKLCSIDDPECEACQ